MTDEDELQTDEIRGDLTPPDAESPAVEQLDVRGDNVDPDGVAHSCGIAHDGSEHCMGCQLAWPCPNAVRLRVEAIAPDEPEPSPETVIATSVSTGLPWRTVADELDVPRADVEAFLGASA